MTLYLARLEEKQDHWEKAAQWLERVKPVSPNPDEIAKQIAEDRQKATQPDPGGSGVPLQPGNTPP